MVLHFDSLNLGVVRSLSKPLLVMMVVGNTIFEKMVHPIVSPNHFINLSSKIKGIRSHWNSCPARITALRSPSSILGETHGLSSGRLWEWTVWWVVGLCKVYYDPWIWNLIWMGKPITFKKGFCPMKCDGVLQEGITKSVLWVYQSRLRFSTQWSGNDCTPPGSGICDAFLQIPIKIWEKIWTTKSDCFSQVGFHRDLAAANWFVKSLTCFSGNPWNFPIWIWPWPNPKNKLRRVSHPRTSSCAFRQLLREMHPPCGEESTPTNSTDHARLDAVLRSIGPASVRGYTQPTLFQSNISQPFFNQTERYEHESLAIQALDFRESSVPTLRAKSCQQIGRWEIYIYI